MASSSPRNHFDDQQAAGYDKRWAPLAPLRDSLHLQMRLVLQKLPAEARILCVGVGTGAELIALAKAFPAWRFVAVDPSAPMLEVCQRNARREGIADRCEFHACYVHELPGDLKCDAATSILVSQFITGRIQRIGFFREIARRLHPGGMLVSADLCQLSADQQERLFPVWQHMMVFSGATPEQAEAMREAYHQNVSLLPLGEIETLLEDAGFENPVHFSQTLLIHAWFASSAR